ncbi:MAG TPA: CHASE3 domain-containing protein [Cyclobacteriaceae bacterium]|jgi:signal transduction histidine kinase|nr:CHASE3 domain-containing protein [Cyclobacteriaceae bacterium]
MKIYLNRNIILGFLFSIILVLGLAFTSYLYFRKMMDVTRWAAHARRVLYHSEQVRSFSVEVETSQRGYGLTGDKLFLEPYQGAIKAIRSHLKELDSLTSDNPTQHGRIIQLQEFVTMRLKFADEVIQLRKESFEKAKDLVLTLRGKKLMDEIKKLLNEFQDEENNLITTRSLNARKQFLQFVYAFLGLVGSMVVILGVLTYLINSNLKQRTQAEKKLKQAEQEAAKINSELESFTYSVSHDLRAPLRSINGYAQILKEDYSDKIDEEGNRTIDIISKNAKRMGQLIDDLLGFARLGRQEIRKSKINMDDLVKAVLAELLDQQKGREVILNIKPLKASLGDINMIRQVWINLLSNALKYSQKKKVSMIEINCREQVESDEIIYSVKDNGAGFDMQYQHKLFGVFHRLHKTEDFEGTGVGLALSKKIIDRHQGRIWAEAKVDEGAVFYFSMPKHL